MKTIVPRIISIVYKLFLIIFEIVESKSNFFIILSSYLTWPFFKSFKPNLHSSDFVNTFLFKTYYSAHIYAVICVGMTTLFINT